MDAEDEDDERRYQEGVGIGYWVLRANCKVSGLGR